MVRTPDGVPSILGSPPHDGIPPGCGFIDDPLSGGVARASLNHRLQDWIPPGSPCQPVLSFQMTSFLKFDRYEIRIPQAGGFPAISRWLSEATPPDCRRSETIPQAGGFPAISRWLSEATPPDCHRRETRIPAGMPDIETQAKGKGGAR